MGPYKLTKATHEHPLLRKCMANNYIQDAGPCAAQPPLHLSFHAGIPEWHQARIALVSTPPNCPAAPRSSSCAAVPSMLECWHQSLFLVPTPEMGHYVRQSSTACRESVDNGEEKHTDKVG